MAAALLVSGCGQFVRDELISMQNEIDRLHEQVEDMNNGLVNLHGIVSQMAEKGYIVDVKEYEDEEHGGFSLFFRTVTLGPDGTVVKDDTYHIDLNNGVDGKDAKPFVLGVRSDGDHWYWYDNEKDDWMRSDDGDRFMVDGKDGKTPLLEIVKDHWCISWDGGKTWETTDWEVKGKDAKEFFSGANVLDDRVELILAADSTVLTLPRFIEVGLSLTLDGESVGENVPIAPGGKGTLAYEITGTGAANAVVVAGTDGRLKTAIRRLTATTGTVEVTCPEVFPEGGYVYVTANDGNGRSVTRVVSFVEKSEPAAGSGE